MDNSSNTEAVNVIHEKIKEGLFNIFGPGPKSKTIEYTNMLSFACPFCHDSAKNLYKKRGTLFKDTLSYRCFNCGHTDSIYGLMRQFGRQLPPEIKDTVNQIREEGRKACNRPRAVFSKINSTEQLNYREMFNIVGVDPLDVINAMKLRPVLKDQTALSYLKSRLIPEQYIKRMLCDNERIYILNVSPDNKSIIGMNSRLYGKNGFGPKYKLFNLSKLYEITGRDAKDLEDMVFMNFLHYNEENREYIPYILELINSISVTNGFFSLDIHRTFYILEGEFDRLFIDNAISLSGVEKNMGIDLFELPTARVIFDNDVAGFKRSFELIDSKETLCFSWSDFCSDNGIDKDSVKDVNDIIKAKGDSGFMKTVDEKYFTNMKYAL